MLNTKKCCYYTVVNCTVVKFRNCSIDGQWLDFAWSWSRMEK